LPKPVSISGIISESGPEKRRRSTFWTNLKKISSPLIKLKYLNFLKREWGKANKLLDRTPISFHNSPKIGKITMAPYLEGLGLSAEVIIRMGREGISWRNIKRLNEFGKLIEDDNDVKKGKSWQQRRPKRQRPLPKGKII
jgi:hypothetical protein